MKTSNLKMRNENSEDKNNFHVMLQNESRSESTLSNGTRETSHVRKNEVTKIVEKPILSSESYQLLEIVKKESLSQSNYIESSMQALTTQLKNQTANLNDENGEIIRKASHDEISLACKLAETIVALNAEKRATVKTMADLIKDLKQK